MSKKDLTESQFYMWRTLFAVAHADDRVSSEEVRYMAEVLEDVPFTESQRTILNADIKNPQDPEAMFAGITDLHDQAVFFKHASSLVHVDGHFGAEEQQILVKLQKLHLKKVNVDSLVGRIDLEFEDEREPANTELKKSGGLKDVIALFRDRFR